MDLLLFATTLRQYVNECVCEQSALCMMWRFLQFCFVSWHPLSKMKTYYCRVRNCAAWCELVFPLRSQRCLFLSSLLGDYLGVFPFSMHLRSGRSPGAFGWCLRIGIRRWWECVSFSKCCSLLYFLLAAWNSAENWCLILLWLGVVVRGWRRR